MLPLRLRVPLLTRLLLRDVVLLVLLLDLGDPLQAVPLVDPLPGLLTLLRESGFRTPSLLLLLLLLLRRRIFSNRSHVPCRLR